MRVLSLKELKTVKGISYSPPHLYRLIKAGEFPKPIKLGLNRNAFVEEEVDAYLKSKVEARDHEGRANAA